MPRVSSAGRRRAATTQPTFFATPALFRKWLEKNHASTGELLVGYYKKDSGKPSLTWPESVDEALCFGWIDGVRRSLGAEAYTIRFTPRRARSIWSAVNIGRAKTLIELGRMHPAGLAAFQARQDERSAVYSHEQRKTAALNGAELKQLKANPKAWAFFQSQPPWYQRAVSHWIQSAKQETTRHRRLATLIADSEKGRTVPPLTRPQGAKPKGRTDR